MHRVLSKKILRESRKDSFNTYKDLQSKVKYRPSVSLILIYCIVGAVFLGMGIWLAKDLISSHASIIAERSVFAVRTSELMSQQFGNTLTATDYVLRDVTTKVTVDELNLANSNLEVRTRLSALVREKLATLPHVTGLGFLDSHAIFVAAADEKLIGIQSNSRLHVVNGEVLENITYVDYVPAAKSANKQPAILVSRPILSSEGTFLGGALAAIMLSWAQDWIETFDIGKYDTMAMVDENGILLACNPSNQDLIGTQLHFTSDQSNIGDHSGSDSTAFVAISPLDGRERIYGLRKTNYVPLYIIVGFDTKNALREWQQRLWQLSIGYLLLLILIVVMLCKHLDVLAQREKMRLLSITDPLTGVANRRQLMLSGELEILRAIRYKNKVSVLMVDIDHFKLINDTWGHSTGDRVLQFLANAMVLNFRVTDVVGRLGGEEFAVVMPETDAENAAMSANRLRDLIENPVNVKPDIGSQVCFTVSIGIACIEDGNTSFEEILGRADRALYDAKDQGRNRVVIA